MSALYGTYARSELAFVRGEGMRLYDQNDVAYLDFQAGIAVNALGYGDPHVVAALKAGADKVFFTNSGAEALECAIKTARHHFYAKGETDRYEVIAFTGSFHGRTLGTIAAGGNPSYLEGFGPPMPGFKHTAPGDLAAVEALITPQTCAILIETVQGEGGVTAMTPEFMQGLRRLCDEHDMLLVLD